MEASSLILHVLDESVAAKVDRHLLGGTTRPRCYASGSNQTDAIQSEGLGDHLCVRIPLLRLLLLLL